MYQIDILKGINWEYFYEHEELKEIDKVVFKLTKLRPNKHMRILQDGNLLMFLNGTENQYWYWKNKVMRKRKVI